MLCTVKDKECKIYGQKYLYTGEADLQDNACGFGTAINADGKYEGSFLNDKAHGFGMSLYMHNRVLLIFI